MSFPPAIAKAVVDAAGKELAERTFAEFRDLQLVPLKKAADLLGVSVPKAKRLFSQYVELGEASRRVRMSDIRRLIEDRTVPA